MVSGWQAAGCKAPGVEPGWWLAQEQACLWEAKVMAVQQLTEWWPLACRDKFPGGLRAKQSQETVLPTDQET